MGHEFTHYRLIAILFVDVDSAIRIYALSPILWRVHYQTIVLLDIWCLVSPDVQ